MQSGSARISRRAALLGGITGMAAVAAGCSGRTAAGTSAPTQPSVQPTHGASSSPVIPSPSPNPTGTASAEEIAARSTVPTLCYHQLREFTGADGHYARAVLVCPPTTFREHLDAIADDGWTTIGPDHYYEHLTAGSPLPDKPVMLTFDDGAIGQLTEGMGQLVERGMTGAFFPMTVVLDKPDWMSTDDIGSLADAGMTIGAHTWDHPLLRDLGGADWDTQLKQPRETLRRASGQEVEHLAYPHGVWNQAAVPHVSEAGYKTAYQLDVDPVDSAAPLLTLRRSLVQSAWSGSDLVDHLRSSLNN